MVYTTPLDAKRKTYGPERGEAMISGTTLRAKLTLTFLAVSMLGIAPFWPALTATETEPIPAPTVAPEYNVTIDPQRPSVEDISHLITAPLLMTPWAPWAILADILVRVLCLFFAWKVNPAAIRKPTTSTE